MKQAFSQIVVYFHFVHMDQPMRQFLIAGQNGLVAIPCALVVPQIHEAPALIDFRQQISRRKILQTQGLCQTEVAVLLVFCQTVAVRFGTLFLNFFVEHLCIVELALPKQIVGNIIIGL